MPAIPALFAPRPQSNDESYVFRSAANRTYPLTQPNGARRTASRRAGAERHVRSRHAAEGGTSDGDDESRGSARGPPRPLSAVRPIPAALPRLSRLPEAELQAEILRRIRAYDLDTGADAIVERALAYPFAPPDESYVLDGRAPRPVRPDDVAPHERHAVLAYGSNASTRALLRKFAGDLHLPVLAGTLEGFDIVYSSHLSAYGSLPVTLHPRPGHELHTFVTLVDDDQLVRLAETEFNYAVRRLDGIRFRGPEIDVEAPIAFVSRHGALGIDGDHIPLRDRDQPTMLRRVRDHLAPDEELDDFIVANVRDPDRAVAFTAELKRRKIAWDDGAVASTVLDT